MANSDIAKTVVLTDGGTGAVNTELEIPAHRVKRKFVNNITSFARPDNTGGNPERRALNMNRVELTKTVHFTCSDDFADKNHNGSGNRPDLDDKEDWINEFYDLLESGKHLELKATNNQTNGNRDSIVGYVHQATDDEQGKQENSVYDGSFKFVREVPMNS